MKLQEQFPMLGSSVDPNELSLTVKSIGVWLIPALVALFGAMGLDITQTELGSLFDNLAILLAAGMSIYGIGRKIFLKFSNK